MYDAILVVVDQWKLSRESFHFMWMRWICENGAMENRQNWERSEKGDVEIERTLD